MDRPRSRSETPLQQGKIRVRSSSAMNSRKLHDTIMRVNPAIDRYIRPLSAGKSRSPTSSPRSVSPHRKARLGDLLPIQVETTLDLSGIKVSKNSDKQISLENFDANRPHSPLLTSPRSVEACLRLGIHPRELLTMPREVFAEDDSDSAIVDMRFSHYEARRKEKMEAVIEQREWIIREKELSKSELSFVKKKEKDTILAARQKAERIIRQHESHAMSMQQYDEHMRKKMQDSQKRMEEMEKKEMEERNQQEKEMARREKERIERQQEYQEQLNRIQLDNWRKAEQRALELELKDEERMRQIEERRMELSKQHAERMKQSNMRIQEAKRRQKLLENQARQMFEEKERKAEERRLRFERLRLQQQEELRKQTEERKNHIRDTQRQNEEREQARIEATLAKVREVDERLEDLARREEEQRLRKREEELERDHKRREILNNARRIEAERIRRIEEKQAKLEESFQRMRMEQEKEAKRHAEEQRLRDIDRQESIERANRRREYERLKMLAKIEGKNRRVEEIHEAKEHLVRENLKTREMIEKNKKHYEPASMGPGECTGQKFGIADEVMGSRAPKFSMGVSKESVQKRVVSQKHAKEFYGRESPGPIYKPPSVFDQISKKGKRPTFGLEDRFCSPQSFLRQSGTISPGPGAYAIDDRCAARGSDYASLQLASTIR